MAYLHSCNIVHYDIKSVRSSKPPFIPQFWSICFLQFNVLVNDQGDACIADFGLAQKYNVAGVATVPTEGPSRWKAPELSRHQLRGGSVPQTPAAADIWAFGMTGLEVRSSLTRTHTRFGGWLNNIWTLSDTRGEISFLSDIRWICRRYRCPEWPFPRTQRLPGG